MIWFLCRFCSPECGDSRERIATTSNSYSSERGLSVCGGGMCERPLLILFIVAFSSRFPMFLLFINTILRKTDNHFLCHVRCRTIISTENRSLFVYVLRHTLRLVTLKRRYASLQVHTLSEWLSMTYVFKRSKVTSPAYSWGLCR
jgi:hypothetical protein